MDQSAKNEAIAQFVSVTAAKPSEAETYLTNCNWDVSSAVTTYFAAQESETDSDVDVDAPTAAEPEYTGPRTLDGRPAPESQTRASAASSSAPRQPPRGGIATLSSIAQPGSHAGHGHSSDSDSDEDAEQPRDLYAGGEKSGQFVQDPNNRGNDARKLVKDIMKKAKEQTAAQRAAILETPAKPSRFTGSGVTLGGEDTPSTVIPVTATGPAPPPPAVGRVLHLWNDGFSVEDGPLHRFDDPRNAADLAQINQGRAPVHLMNVAYGQSVDVKLVRHETDYVKPKTAWKPFGGSGQRLGSPVPGEDTTPAQAAPAPAPAAASSGGASATPEVKIDSSQPTLNLRIQLADGTRLPARFNTTHTIGDIYDFISLASPSSGGRAWVVSTTFPNKDHTDKSQVLGEMAEFKRGGTAVQKWL